MVPSQIYAMVLHLMVPSQIYAMTPHLMVPSQIRYGAFRLDLRTTLRSILFRPPCQHYLFFLSLSLPLVVSLMSVINLTLIMAGGEREEGHRGSSHNTCDEFSRSCLG